MSKAVLLSIKPQYCELIASGKKTVEVRKTRPKIDTPFKCYIYCTQGDALAYPCLNNPQFAIHRMIDSRSLYGRRMTPKEREESDYTFANGKVIGEFSCDDIRWANGVNLLVKEDAEDTLKGSCLTIKDIYKYLDVKPGTSRYEKKYEFYRWHISDLVIYDRPKELSEFRLYDCSVKIEDGYPMPTHEIKRPPQSWCYVEELRWSDAYSDTY